jgi:2-iminobutanoate/2-iminopropanoate deaminase
MSERRWTPIFLGGDVPTPVGAYSPAVRAGDFVYVSGQVPRDLRTGALVGETVEAQTEQVLANLRATLAAAGAQLSDVVSATIFLANEQDWGAVNAIWKAAFVAPYPARTTVGARLRGILVEVNAVAYVPLTPR